MPCRDCGDDQACEHEEDADELHRGGYREREQRVEAETLEAIAHPEPAEQH
jgi:hypothetical protein